MALDSSQQASRLFKKSLGAGETIVTRQFFEEPRLGNNSILPSQIWSEADSIPNTAPGGTNGQITGVVQRFIKQSLTFISGSVKTGRDVSFYHANLVDAIPFNYGDGVSYVYSLYESDGTTAIAFGIGDWLVDSNAGVLTFYGTPPSSITSAAPPQISFYKYVGTKGLGSTTGATSGIQVKDPVRFATASGDTISNYNSTLSGYTSLPNTVDGVTGSTLIQGDRILIKNQVDTIQNGIFQVSGTTLVRAADSDGNPFGEVGINDYTFVTSGSTNLASSWVLGGTNAIDSNDIRPGVDTQTWALFARSAAYTADGLSLKLNGQIFSVGLDETGLYGSGLYQSTGGLRITTTLANTISGNTSDILTISGTTSTTTSSITSLSSAISSGDLSLSGQISVRTSVDSSLSSAISSNDSSDSSLSSAVSSGDLSLSGQISVRTSVDSSLSSAISSGDLSLSGQISVRTSVDVSLSSAISSGGVSTSSLSSAISSGDLSLSGQISVRTSVDSSLSSAISSGDLSLSGQISVRTSVDLSLSSAISVGGVSTSSLSSAISSGDLSLSGQISVRTSVDSSLSSAISSEISSRTTGDTSLSSSISSINLSLSSAISNEISSRVSADSSIITVINNLSGVTATTAGSGLTYNSGNTSLNVNVDDWTIRIINDKLFGTQQWVQQTTTANVTGTTSGYTGLALTYDSVTPVSAYVNGIEYLVNPGTNAVTNYPFFYNAYPPMAGTQIWFNPVTAGFTLNTGIDMVVIKYLIVEDLIQ